MECECLKRCGTEAENTHDMMRVKRAHTTVQKKDVCAEETEVA